ncbi:MAG: hypothetical protein HRU70_14780 [Phycisphaeraceae bacterium]|nr:MAG: hypothetical protein HRU70_14780 [Phycisphaeraceae bacterium]
MHSAVLDGESSTLCVPLSGAYFAGEGGGHEYAPMSVSGCDEEETLEALALAIEQAGCEDWGEGCEEAVGQLMGQACGWLCIPITQCSSWLPTGNGAWNPDPWRFDRSVPLTGGGVQCHYKRLVKRQVKRFCTSVNIFCRVSHWDETSNEWFEQEDYCDEPLLQACPPIPTCLQGVPASPRPQDIPPKVGGLPVE